MFRYNSKETFRNAIEKVNIAKQRAQLALMTAVALGTPVPVLAATGGTDPNTTLRGVLDLVTLVFPLIGAPLALAGAFKLFMAYRNNQPEEMSSATKDLAIGIVMIVFRVLIWPSLANLIL